MIDLLLYGAPDTVEVASETVSINTNWRAAIQTQVTDTDDEYVLAALILSAFYMQDGVLPQVVEDNPKEAIEAALEWRDKALTLIDYGRKKKRRASSTKRTFDWDADSTIICADFMRFYHIDLMDKACHIHWYTFCQLFLALLITPDALISQAVSARTPSTTSSSKAERDMKRKQAQAWALPMTHDELVEEIRKNF